MSYSRSGRGSICFLILMVFAGLVFASCSILPGRDSGTSGESGDGIDFSNGERIYFTASSKRAEGISYQGGPNFGGMMMGAYLTCASCHGPEARGGVHTMHMQVMEAPDIRYAALNSAEEEHEGEAHAGEAGGEYDLEDFRLAVIEGEHPDGESLSREMPRWRMEDEDLADLFAFLKSLE
jgi:hypothetical protein